MAQAYCSDRASETETLSKSPASMKWEIKTCSFSCDL